MRDRAIDRAMAGMTSALRAPPHAHEPLSIVDGDLVHQRDIDQKPTRGREARIGMSA
jgi:hypothetical protein